MWRDVRKTDLLCAVVTFTLGVASVGLLSAEQVHTESAANSAGENRGVVRLTKCGADEQLSKRDDSLPEQLDYLKKEIRETELQLVELKQVHSLLSREAELERTINIQAVELRLGQLEMKLKTLRNKARSSENLVYRELGYDD